VQTLAGVIVDGCAEVFQVPPGAASIATVALISTARITSDPGQRRAAPPVIETLEAAVKLTLVLLCVPPVGEID